MNPGEVGHGNEVTMEESGGSMAVTQEKNE